MSLSPTQRRSLAGNNRRILFALLAVIVAMGCGAIGFYLIEGWSILDSLYAAAQTVTTVATATLRRPPAMAALFATVFMLAGVGVVLYALTTTVHAIVQSELVATFGERRQSEK